MDTLNLVYSGNLMSSKEETFVCVYREPNSCVTQTFPSSYFNVLDSNGKNLLCVFPKGHNVCILNNYVCINTEPPFGKRFILSNDLNIFVVVRDKIKPYTFQVDLLAKFFFACTYLSINNSMAYICQVDWIPDWLVNIFKYVLYKRNTHTTFDKNSIPNGMKHLFGFTDNDIANSNFCNIIYQIAEIYELYLPCTLLNFYNIIGYMYNVPVNSSNIEYHTVVYHNIEIYLCLDKIGIPLDIINIIKNNSLIIKSLNLITFRSKKNENLNI